MYDMCYSMCIFSFILLFTVCCITIVEPSEFRCYIGPVWPTEIIYIEYFLILNLKPAAWKKILYMTRKYIWHHSPSLSVRLACACHTFHYMKRLTETIFVHRFSHGTLPLRSIVRVRTSLNLNSSTFYIIWPLLAWLMRFIYLFTCDTAYKGLSTASLMLSYDKFFWKVHYKHIY